MGGASESTTQEIQQQQQTTDSYNTTYDQVLNLADVGNVKINFPGASQASGSVAGLSPTMLLGAGALLIGALFLLRR
jgi:hypothetical protein